MNNSTLPIDVGSIRKLFFTIIFFLTSVSIFSQLGWVQVTSPNPSSTRNMIRGISGTSSSDVWAVGSYEETISYNPYNIQHDLILHWNGSSWEQFPAMQLSTTLDDLWDVEAISASNAWAVGAYNDFATTRAELLHYDGNAWTNQSLPFITGGSYLFALHAVSPTDIWAAGGKSGSPTRPCYTIHYNGSSWTEISVPVVGSYRNVFNDIHGISSSDVWAVGHWTNSYGQYHALAMHWNGTTWINIGLPSNIVSQISEIQSIKMISSNDVWAVGSFATGGMFKIHWDGSNWTEITPTNGGGGAFAVLSTNNVFAVGGEISHWDGTDWTIADSLTQLHEPSLVSTVVFSNGEIWAGGRTTDALGNFYTLIYRSVNQVPLFAGGAVQSWSIVTNSVTNSPGSLLLTIDADVCQVLSYSIVTAPIHGTLSGLPASAITNNGSATPAGINYTPVAGFSGSDQFVIRVAAGPVNSETTITVYVLEALPVTLLNFQVNKQGGNAILKWTTLSESNTQKFEVEHSTDGIYFTSVGFVTAKGTSYTASEYVFIHETPVPGPNYYRLKLFNLDGTTNLFPVKSIRFDTGMLEQIIVLNNPLLDGKINLQINSTGVFQINLYNLQGQKLFVKNINNVSRGSRYTVNLPHTIQGLYILKVINGSEQFTFKLLLGE